MRYSRQSLFQYINNIEESSFSVNRIQFTYLWITHLAYPVIYRHNAITNYTIFFSITLTITITY